MEKEIIQNIPDYNGPGVYAIIDQNGKKYIGSSLHINSRLLDHKRSLNNAIKRNQNGENVTLALQKAAVEGQIFDAVILEKLPNGGTFYDLMDMERKHLEASGGIKRTYNSMFIKDYKASDYRLLQFQEKYGNNYCERIKRTIEKREKPIVFVESEAVVKKHIKSRDNITLRPKKDDGAKIREAAAAAGKTVHRFILDIVYDAIGYTPEK